MNSSFGKLCNRSESVAGAVPEARNRKGGQHRTGVPTWGWHRMGAGGVSRHRTGGAGGRGLCSHVGPAEHREGGCSHTGPAVWEGLGRWQRAGGAPRKGPAPRTSMSHDLPSAGRLVPPHPPAPDGLLTLRSQVGPRTLHSRPSQGTERKPNDLPS